MPGPLVCEGPDLERLLAEVHGQPGAQILYQDQVRRGGMFGFFAREVHRIAYRVADEDVADEGMADEGMAGAVPDGGELAVPVAGLPVDGGPEVLGGSPAAQLYAGA